MFYNAKIFKRKVSKEKKNGRFRLYTVLQKCKKFNQKKFYGVIEKNNSLSVIVVISDDVIFFLKN